MESLMNSLLNRAFRIFTRWANNQATLEEERFGKPELLNQPLETAIYDRVVSFGRSLPGTVQIGIQQNFIRKVCGVLMCMFNPTVWHRRHPWIWLTYLALTVSCILSVAVSPSNRSAAAKLQGSAVVIGLCSVLQVMMLQAVSDCYEELVMLLAALTQLAIVVFILLLVTLMSKVLRIRFKCASLCSWQLLVFLPFAAVLSHFHSYANPKSFAKLDYAVMCFTVSCVYLYKDTQFILCDKLRYLQADVLDFDLNIFNMFLCLVPLSREIIYYRTPTSSNYFEILLKQMPRK